MHLKLRQEIWKTVISSLYWKATETDHNNMPSEKKIQIEKILNNWAHFLCWFDDYVWEVFFQREIWKC